MVTFKINREYLFYALDMSLYTIYEELEYGHTSDGFGYVNMVI